VGDRKKREGVKKEAGKTLGARFAAGKKRTLGGGGKGGERKANETLHSDPQG